MKIVALLIVAGFISIGGIVVAGQEGDCPDATEQTKVLELKIAQLQGRAWRAEQETAAVMLEVAELRDQTRWWTANHVLVEVGTDEWADERRACGIIDNGVLAVEQGAARR